MRIRMFQTVLLRSPRKFAAARSMTSSSSGSSTSAAAAANDNTTPNTLVDLFPPQIGTHVSDAMMFLAKSDCVCFDVDSTVVTEEGIDMLADYLGQGQQVAALTKQAMEGGMKFQDALAARLQLMRPSKQSIEALLQERPLCLTDGVQELVAALQAKNKHVYLVSGGFRIMIEPVAKLLNIPANQIVANTILFDASGSYAGFDDTEPTSKDMGKPKALKMIATQNNFDTMIMVGDGATDAQAKPPAKAFIGFGGVVVRETVKTAADWFVTDFEAMTRIVKDYGE
jgi:phosphoserine phosphatase